MQEAAQVKAALSGRPLAGAQPEAPKLHWAPLSSALQQLAKGQHKAQSEPTRGLECFPADSAPPFIAPADYAKARVEAMERTAAAATWRTSSLGLATPALPAKRERQYWSLDTPEGMAGRRPRRLRCPHR